MPQHRPPDPAPRPATLLSSPPRVVNIGLASFAEVLQAGGHEVVQLDWAPPRELEPRLARILAHLGA